jgi:hypothetical protein
VNLPKENDVYKKLKDIDLFKPNHSVVKPVYTDSLNNNKPPVSLYEDHLRLQKEVIKQMEDKRKKDKKDVDYIKFSLKNIEHNMATLKDINYHLQLNTAQQKEIFDLIVELLAILKTSNKKEAEGKFQKVKAKIESLKADYETVIWLFTMLEGARQLYQSLPPIPNIKP